MDNQSASTKARHIPRRSGVVGTERGEFVRQVLTPKVKKPRRLRLRSTVTLCNAVHPERVGIVSHETGEQLVHAVTCGRTLKFEKGELVPHKGPHRAHLLRGHVEAWTGAEAVR